MKAIVESDDKGELHLPASFLPGASPHARYEVEVREREVVLWPEAAKQALWQVASPRERAEDILRWAASHRDGPGLPDEALTRETMYD